MRDGEKYYIKLFGINSIKVKKIYGNIFEIYFLGLPLFSAEKTGNKMKINILLMKKIVWHFAKRFKQFHATQKNIKANQAICEKFKNGEKIKICLQTSRPGMWNFDTLYKILKNDNRFDPIPLVMPDPFQGKETMLKYVKGSLKELTEKNLPAISGYDFENDKYIDLKKDINPDIILYIDFWKPHFPGEFYIDKFLDKITLLNGYGISVMQDEKTCTWELNNLVDIYFRTTSIHKQMAEKLMSNCGKNVIAVGSPKVDPIFDKSYISKDVWKAQEKPKKRIIWAPHHSRYMPNDMYCCNAFWEIYDFMLDMAEKYKDTVQFAFRPHPMLKAKVEKYWGEYAANNYYHKWSKLENCQYSEGNFIDLFLTSDAMIMDSCSFLAEYTATNKPLFYTRTETSRLNLNEFGEKLREHIYDTENNLENDIENFIRDVVINGNDYKKEGRTKFINEFIKPQNGKSASENIYNEIVNYLEKGAIND